MPLEYGTPKLPNFLKSPGAWLSSCLKHPRSKAPQKKNDWRPTASIILDSAANPLGMSANFKFKDVDGSPGKRKYSGIV